MADGEVIVDVGMNTDEAIKQWSNYKQYIEKSQSQMERELEQKANNIIKLEEKLTQTKKEGRMAVAQMKSYEQTIKEYNDLYRAKDYLDAEIRRVARFENSLTTPSGSVIAQNRAEYDRVHAQLTAMQQKYEQIKVAIRMGKQEVTEATQRHAELNSEVEKYKDKVRIIKSQLTKQKTDFDNMRTSYSDLNQKADTNEKLTKKIEKNHKHIATHSKKSGINIAGGLKSLLRMSLALVGIRGLYTGMTSLVNRWLNSEDEVAKQTKADMESIKDSLAKLLAPAIKGVVSLLYEALGVIGAITKAMFNLDIFTKKTAKNTAESSKNAKSMLASFDKIDVLNNDDNDTGEPEATDFTPYIKKYETLANEVKEIFSTVLDPFQKAWDTKGIDVITQLKNSANEILGLFQSMGTSFLKPFQDGRVQKQVEGLLTLLEKCLKYVGNISSVWKKAWENNGIGDKIVSDLADGFQGLIDILDDVVDTMLEISQSEEFQRFADSTMKAIESITGVVKYLIEYIKNWYENQGGEGLLKTIVDTCLKIGTLINTIIEKLKPIIENSLEKLKPYFETVTNFFTYLIEGIGYLSDALTDLLNGNWSGAKNNAKKGAQSIGNAYKEIGKFAEQTMKKVDDFNESIAEQYQEIVDFSKDGNANDLGWYIDEEGTIRKLDNVQEKFEETNDAIYFDLRDASKIVDNGYEEVTDVIESRTNEVPSIVKTNFDKAKSSGLSVIQALVKGVDAGLQETYVSQSTSSKINSTLKSPFATGKDSVTTVLGTISKSVNSELAKVNVTTDTKNQVVNQITNPFTTVKDKLKSIFSTIKDTIETCFIGLQNKNLFNNIIGKFEEFGNNVKTGFANAFKGIGDLFSKFSISNLKDKVQGLLSNVKFPRLARGGIVTQSTPAIIGEAGKEAVIPLENNTEFLDALAERLSGGTGDININFTGSLSQLARVLKPEIDKENRRIGNTVVKGGVY